jgi:tetratricopeptide (TPR) repeat protein
LQTESLHTSRHPETILTRKRLAQVLVQRGDRTVAKSLYSELLSDERARSGESHPAVAGILQALGEILYAEKDPDCESVFQRALEIREQTLGADAFDVTVTLTWLAEICLDRRDYVRGEQLYRRALTTRERTLGADSVALLVPKMKLALALCGLNRAAEARPFSEEALFGMMQNLPPEHPNYRFAVEIYSLVRARLGQ